MRLADARGCHIARHVAHLAVIAEAVQARVPARRVVRGDIETGAAVAEAVVDKQALAGLLLGTSAPRGILVLRYVPRRWVAMYARVAVGAAVAIPARRFGATVLRRAGHPRVILTLGGVDAAGCARRWQETIARCARFGAARRFTGQHFRAAGIGAGVGTASHLAEGGEDEALDGRVGSWTRQCRWSRPRIHRSIRDSRRWIIQRVPLRFGANVGSLKKKR